MLSRKPVQKLKDSGDSDAVLHFELNNTIPLVEIVDIAKLIK